MKDRILTLFFLIVVTQCGAAQQGNGRCHLSRLSCPSEFADMTDQYYVYFTKLRRERCNSTTVACCKRPRKPNFVVPMPITTVGTENTKIIYSPGFIRRKAYPNELYVEYSIDCNEGDQAFFNLTYFHLQGKECGDGMCEDFIIVDRGGSGFGTKEFCGNSSDPTLVLQLQKSGNFKVKFRTSEYNRYPGFEMYIICFPKGTGRRKRSCNNRPVSSREQIELNKMNDVLFNAIPESADISFENIEDFSGAGSGTVSDPGTEFIHEDQRTREACSENVSLVAERNLRARNPILRQQARSLQALLNQRRAAGNDTFSFICSFMNNSLRCRVDDGFAPAVINGSYCTPNGGRRRKCDPFHGEFSSDDQSIIIEAINCDGQSATVTATRGQSG